MCLRPLREQQHFEVLLALMQLRWKYEGLMITLEAVQSATERHAAYEERAVRMQQVAEQRPDNERIEFRKTGVIE